MMNDGIRVKIGSLRDPEALFESDLRWWLEADPEARLRGVDEARRDAARLRGESDVEDGLPGVNRNFEELLGLLSDRGARFLVVGGYAVAFHAIPRYTKDIDLLVEPTLANAKRVLDALTAFIGDPGIRPDRLTSPDTVIMLGIPPTRIDLLTSIDGIARFADAWKNRVAGRYGDAKVAFIGLDDLIAAKRAAGRAQDLADAERLEKVRALRRKGAKRSSRTKSGAKRPRKKASRRKRS